MKAVIQEYGQKFQQYAPYGYALLVARTRDFHLSQTILEDALARGFGGYKNGYFAASSPRVALQSMRRVIKEQIEAVPIVASDAAEASSISRASRIRQIEDHLEAVFTFQDKELMALVLRYVEEIDPATITEWTGVHLERQEDLRKELEKRVGSLDACQRTLIQYRLPGRFLPDLLNRIHEQWKGNITLQRTLWMFLGALAAGAAIIIDPDFALGTLRHSGLGGLGVVFGIAVAVIIAQRILREFVTGDIFGRPKPKIGTLRLVLISMGVPLLIAQALLANSEFLSHIAPHRVTILDLDGFFLILTIVTVQSVAVYSLMRGLLPLLGAMAKKIPGTERTVPGR